MRIAARLVLTLGLTTAAVMAVYALLAQHQRETLLGDALVRETGPLAHTLQIVTNIPTTEPAPTPSRSR